jgi:lysophospholipase L1-like esterase
LFFSGLYRPVTSLHEIQDQVSAVSKIALSKAHKVVWIQHNPIQSNRIVLERSIYRRYYREIIDALSPMVSENFKVMQLPRNFLKAENYLLDGVHLSVQGHMELAELIEEKFGGLLSD